MSRHGRITDIFSPIIPIAKYPEIYNQFMEYNTDVKRDFRKIALTLVDETIFDLDWIIARKIDAAVVDDETLW